MNKNKVFIFIKSKLNQLVDSTWIGVFYLVYVAWHVTVVGAIKASQNSQEVARRDFHIYIITENAN